MPKRKKYRRNPNKEEEELQDWLEVMIDDASGPNVRIRSFQEAGVMTRNAGLVMTYKGMEFQISIVRSR